MYEIKVSKIVDKFLEKHRELAKHFVEKLEILQTNPFQNHLDVKSLKGKKNHFRLRIGKYRFLYEVIEDKILIYFYDADSRGDIYK